MHYATCAKHDAEAGEADCASCIIEDLEARISTRLARRFTTNELWARTKIYHQERS